MGQLGEDGQLEQERQTHARCPCRTNCGRQRLRKRQPAAAGYQLLQDFFIVRWCDVSKLAGVSSSPLSFANPLNLGCGTHPRRLPTVASCLESLQTWAQKRRGRSRLLLRTEEETRAVPEDNFSSCIYLWFQIPSFHVHSSSYLVHRLKKFSLSQSSSRLSRNFQVDLMKGHVASKLRRHSGIVARTNTDERLGSLGPT